MRVLLTAHCTPDTIGGTQSWNRTVAGELDARRHSTFIAGAGDRVQPDVHFDVAIVSQKTTFEAARTISDHVIFVSHGIGELEECPLGADAYVFVSEEVRSRATISGRIIRQPIDTEFWKPGTGHFVDVLRVSPYGGMDWLPGLCDEMGLSFRHMREERDTTTLRAWCRGATVVVASGRSALEAMACGRPVIIADHRPYNGKHPMGESDCEHAMATNYSGRGGGPISRNGMEVALRYNLGMVPSLRSHVLKHHDVSSIVDQLLALVPDAVTA